MQNARQRLQNQILKIRINGQTVHRMYHFFIFADVIAPFHFDAARLRQVIKLIHGLECEVFLHVLGCTGQEHVENVVVSLHRSLLHDAALLEQIRLHVATFDVVFLVAVYLHVLAKPRRVIIAHRFGVTEALQERIGVEDLVLNAGTNATCCAAADRRQELQNLFGGFGLTRSRFTCTQTEDSKDNAIKMIVTTA